MPNGAISKQCCIGSESEEEVSLAVRWLRSYFDVAQHERRATFGDERNFRHTSHPVIARSLRRSTAKQRRKPISRLAVKASDTVMGAQAEGDIR